MPYVIYGSTNLSHVSEFLSIHNRTVALLIQKYIPHSGYQVKTMNRCQAIQALLKHFDNYFHAGTTSH